MKTELYVAGPAFISDILKALGIDGPARKVTITASYDSAVMVDVERFAVVADGRRIVEVFRMATPLKVAEVEIDG